MHIEVARSIMVGLTFPKSSSAAVPSSRASQAGKSIPRPEDWIGAVETFLRSLCNIAIHCAGILTSLLHFTRFHVRIFAFLLVQNVVTRHSHARHRRRAPRPRLR